MYKNNSYKAEPEFEPLQSNSVMDTTNSTLNDLDVFRGLKYLHKNDMTGQESASVNVISFYTCPI